MADWKKLAKSILLADGKIDDREVAVLRKELFADNRIDEVELQFVLELKKSAPDSAPAFAQLVFDALKVNVLADGKIDPSEASFLRGWILADGKVDPGEKKFLQDLKAGAKQSCKEFDQLFTECMAK